MRSVGDSFLTALVNAYFLHGRSRKAEQYIYDRAITKPFALSCIKLRDLNFYK